MPVDKLELLKRAKEYMELLAQGTDPVSGQKLSREDPMGSERMSRCFAFVAATLGEVIAQREGGSAQGAGPGGEAAPPSREKAGKKRAEKAVFSISPEQLEAVAATGAPANLSEMARRLNGAAELERSDLSSSLLSGGLERMGFMETQEGQDGKRHRLPTQAGLDIGMERIRCFNAAGQPYMINVLTEEGQRFLLDNLEAVLEAGRRAREETEAQKAVQKAQKLAEKARAAMEQARAVREEPKEQ